MPWISSEKLSFSCLFFVEVLGSIFQEFLNLDGYKYEQSWSHIRQSPGKVQVDSVCGTEHAPWCYFSKSFTVQVISWVNYSILVHIQGNIKLVKAIYHSRKSYRLPWKHATFMICFRRFTKGSWYRFVLPIKCCDFYQIRGDNVVCFSWRSRRRWVDLRFKVGCFEGQHLDSVLS